MKIVGETNFSLMGKAIKAPKSMKKKSNKIICVCGVIYFESENNLKHYPLNSTHCTKCRIKKIAQDKREVNQAIIAVTKNRRKI